jgi:cytochrome c
MRVLLCAVAALFIVATPAHANPAENDEAMLKLAAFGGCMACHTILPVRRRADGRPPIAPAWRDIAIRYRNDPAASDRLTRLVMTGSDLNVRHWAGKASVDSMPPNAVEITEADARMLVNWILILVP